MGANRIDVSGGISSSRNQGGRELEHPAVAGRNSIPHLSRLWGFCGISKCRVWSAKDLHFHLPHEPLMLSALFVDDLASTSAHS
jgi:hypothetical protein